MCEKKHSLFYFDVIGRGEAIIMIFKHAGVEFEDHRISFSEFSEVKYNSTSCGFDLASGVDLCLGILWSCRPSDPFLQVYVETRRICLDW